MAEASFFEQFTSWAFVMILLCFFICVCLLCCGCGGFLPNILAFFTQCCWGVGRQCCGGFGGGTGPKQTTNKYTGDKSDDIEGSDNDALLPAATHNEDEEYSFLKEVFTCCACCGILRTRQRHAPSRSKITAEPSASKSSKQDPLSVAVEDPQTVGPVGTEDKAESTTARPSLCYTNGHLPLLAM